MEPAQCAHFITPDGVRGRLAIFDPTHMQGCAGKVVRPLPSPLMGLPRLHGSPFRRAVPTTPADQAGAYVDCFPAHTASPNGRRVGIRIVTFEACSGFTRVTARRIAQPPWGDLCHEASALAVARTSRSSATGSIDNSPGGIFLH